MAEHGTVECFDQGCRRPVCVHAQQQRVEAARRAELESIVTAAIPSQSPAEVEEDPAPVDPPDGEPSIDHPTEEPAP